MTGTITIRATNAGDIAAVDALLARSYPVLLRPDYPPSVMVTAVPILARAQPRLMQSGTYYVAEDEGGRILAAGGWTRNRRRPEHGDIRHIVTDHRLTRRGVGRALMGHITDVARAGGVRVLDCLATRTAVPFYRAVGFVEVGRADVTLGPGIVFPAIRMVRQV